MDVSQVASRHTPIPYRSSTGGSSGSVQPSPALASPGTTKKASSITADPLSSPAPDRVAQAIKQMNDAFAQRGQDLYAAFEKDKIAGIDIVKIMDKKTNEVIRQLPPKEIVAFAQALELPQGWRGQLLQAIS